MKDEGKYKCSECGKHLEVLRIRGYERVNVERYECVCDNECAVALERASVDYEKVISYAWLNDDGAFEFHDSCVDRRGSDTQDWEVFCPDCGELDEYDSRMPEIEEESCRELPEKERWTVRCARCCKDFKFAWTEPDRGGRIVVEGIDDFDPDETFPEPTI